MCSILYSGRIFDKEEYWAKLGGFLFLMMPSRSLRLFSLVSAALAFPLVLSVGMYTVFPMQEWAADVVSFRVWESIQPLLDTPAVVILICLPALLSRLPPLREESIAAAIQVGG